MKYIVSKFHKGELKEIGTITYENGKVTLDFKEPGNSEFFESIGIGSRGYTPEDGREYMDAVELAFCRSTADVISKLD